MRQSLERQPGYIQKRPSTQIKSDLCSSETIQILYSKGKGKYMEMFEAESISAVHNYQKRCPRAKIHVKHRILGLIGSPKRKGLDAVK
jgi:hypothetical protein